MGKNPKRRDEMNRKEAARVLIEMWMAGKKGHRFNTEEIEALKIAARELMSTEIVEEILRQVAEG